MGRGRFLLFPKSMGKRGSMKNEPIQAERKYKDTIFRMLFRDKKNLLALYNAVTGKRYEEPEELQIVTLENAVYVGMKNDLAFVIDFGIYLYEHQSTINPNMPYRMFQYISEEYEKLTKEDNLYDSRLVKIPTPHFVVFYNGVDSIPERQVLKLSDAYIIKEEFPQLELQVLVLNINDGYNEEIKEQCRILGEYMQYVNRVRRHQKGMSLTEAVDRAVNECIREGILRDFLLANKAEVKKMSIYEYDEEATKKLIAKNAYEDGMLEGITQGISQGISQGIAQGESRLACLIQGLVEAGRSEELSKVAEDREYRNQLYKEFNL